jgi:hypothetical protein
MSDQEQSIQPPPESDRMLRHTWIWQFEESDRISDFLDALGDLVLEYAREGHAWGGSDEWKIIPGSLNAIAEDLESLAACLEEVANEPAESSVTREDLVLCRKAETWREAVRGIVLEIRRGIGTEAAEA